MYQQKQHHQHRLNAWMTQLVCIQLVLKEDILTTETTAVPEQAMVAACQATSSRSESRTMAAHSGDRDSTLAHAVLQLKIMWLHLRSLKYV